jgi:hypothetical protein
LVFVFVEFLFDGMDDVSALSFTLAGYPLYIFGVDA